MWATKDYNNYHMKYLSIIIILFSAFANAQGNTVVEFQVQGNKKLKSSL